MVSTAGSLRTPKWLACLPIRVIAGEAYIPEVSGRTLPRGRAGHATGGPICVSLRPFPPIRDGGYLRDRGHASLSACAQVAAKLKRRTSIGLSDQGTGT